MQIDEQDELGDHELVDHVAQQFAGASEPDELDEWQVGVLENLNENLYGEGVHFGF